MTNDILVVDDDLGTIKVMGRILFGIGRLRVATCGEVALRLARDAVPDLILLDAEMPDMNGFEVCETLKTDPVLADVPVIFVTSHGEEALEVTGLDMGAVDFIAKPFSAPLVQARVRTQLRVKHLTDELRRISAMDPVTGVANRRHFNESLEREWLRARHRGEPLSLLLIDVDHFKLFNRRYGHAAGDACLRCVAQALQVACLHPADVVARYGGDTFALLLPQTPREGAEHMARRVLDAAEALDIPHESSTTARHVTVRIGIACYDQASTSGWDGPADARSPRARCAASKLQKTAERALNTVGRARARLLDIADVDTPWMAHDVARFTAPVASPLISLQGFTRELETGGAQSEGVVSAGDRLA